MQGLTLQGQVLCRSGKIAAHLFFGFHHCLLFSWLCAQLFLCSGSLFNSSVGIAVKFDLKCKDLPSTFHLFPTVSNLRERSRRHVGLIEFGSSMKIAEIAFAQGSEIRRLHVSKEALWVEIYQIPIAGAGECKRGFEHNSQFLSLRNQENGGATKKYGGGGDQFSCSVVSDSL